MGCLACLRSRKGKLALLLFICGLVILSLLLNLWASREGAVEIVYPVQQESSNRDILEVSIIPASPAVSMGSSAQIVCLVSGGTNFYFETPSLPDSLRSSVNTFTHVGGVVLTIERVAAGHSGVYTCHATGRMGTERTQSVELRVLAEGAPADGPEEHTAPSSPPSSQNAASSLTSHASQSVFPPSSAATSSPPSPSSPSPSSPSPSSPSPSSSSSSSASTNVQFSVVKREGERTSNLSQTASPLGVQSSLSFEEVGKFQRAQVDKFCQKHNLQHLKYSVPSPSNGGSNLFAFNRHMLLDDEHKVLFCFVPKVGCTNLKLLFFVTQGAVPRGELSKPRDRVNQFVLDTAIRRESFASRDDDTKVAVLKSYFKFAMFRNPLERLASGYRSKVERFELFGLRADTPPYNWLQKAIYNYTHPQRYSTWAQSRGNIPVSIVFGDFIDYWLASPDTQFKFDEHFLLIGNICQPCRTRFDFYGNFHHFDHDAQVLISKIGASSTELRSGYYSEETSTEARMQQYYSSLSEAQKRQVLKKMAVELEFYYTIFPEETDSHKAILGLSDDLPQL